MVANYAESPVYTACATLRFFVSATATESIQMTPMYLVIGMKKFAGYAIRPNDESSPVIATSIPRATIHDGRRSRIKWLVMETPAANRPNPTAK
jgi:hypothetical protein